MEFFPHIFVSFQTFIILLVTGARIVAAADHDGSRGVGGGEKEQIHFCFRQISMRCVVFFPELFFSICALCARWSNEHFDGKS